MAVERLRPTPGCWFAQVETTDSQSVAGIDAVPPAESTVELLTKRRNEAAVLPDECSLGCLEAGKPCRVATKPMPSTDKTAVSPKLVLGAGVQRDCWGPSPSWLG